MKPSNESKCLPFSCLLIDMIEKARINFGSANVIMIVLNCRYSQPVSYQFARAVLQRMRLCGGGGHV